MAKTAIIAARGFEEGETLTIVDILRRAEIDCDIIGLTETEVTGAHGVTVRADRLIDDSLSQYDMLILPGGYGGAEAMTESELLREQLAKADKNGKLIAAICAAPTVLDRAGLLEGRRFTCYPSTAGKIHSGSRSDELIVTDGNLITSQAPGTAYAFAYALVDALGGDSETVKKRMVYSNAFDSSGNQHKPSEPQKAFGNYSAPKAAVLMVEGFEESETVQIIDLLRRANVETHSFRFQDDEYVLSMQNVYVKADKRFGGEIKDYDIVIVPGGRKAGARLAADNDVLEMLRYFNRNCRLIAGMCSGTTVLKAADVIEGKRVTGYTGYAEKLTGAVFCSEVAVFDQNVITSQGPATPFPFAFKIMEALGIDPSPMKERLLYTKAGGK